LKISYLVIPSLLLSSALFALPEGEKVAAGRADFQRKNSHSLAIKTSEKAIINYHQFHIGEKEYVEFIQPSAKSLVLNRIKGQDPSKILGHLKANGRVFLVNPNGIYFGPNASVNTGSFLASTLNIRDEDFLNDKFEFYLEPGTEHASIVNEGVLAANPEGFIALFAPSIEQRGSILAKAGKVALAAGEKVVLDFSGDGRIQFSVDGELKKALIENAGAIDAVGGTVSISLKTARDAIKMVVNSDGITPANAMEEVNGIVRLVHHSKIVADSIAIDGGEGSSIDVRGTIDARNLEPGGTGGTVHVLGENVQLLGAHILASGDVAGGTVLVGGDYQGHGSVRNAQNAVMDQTSMIQADAYRAGDGGKVIVWSDSTTLFDGTIYARGGLESGNGGFVETSGKIDLGVQTGHVDTSAPQGKFGDWLLDPASITIATGGGSTIAQCSAPNCATPGNSTISPATIAAATSNVALCAQNAAGSSITVTNAVTMTNSGISLSLTAGSTNVGTINLNNSLTTRGGAISLTGVVTLGAGVTLDTTNAGGTAAGANITFSNTVNGANTLTCTGGTGGVVTFTGAVGGTTALASLTATGATITQSSTAKTTGALSYTGSTAINVSGNVTTSGGVITMTGPVTAAGTPTFDSTNAGGTAAGANINFTSTLNGTTAITFRAGTAGNVIFSGAVGGTSAPTNLSFTSAALIQIGSNVTVSGANTLTFPSPVSLTGTSTITTNNASLSFGSTLNGAQALTIAGGSGTTTFTGAVGGTTALSSLSATAATVTQSSTAKTTGALTYTGSTAINVAGNVTTSGGIITMTGPVTASGSPTFDSTNAGGTAAGANISFSSTLNGATAITLRAGTAGNVIFSGAVGGTTAPTNLSFTSANQIQIGSNVTVSGANPLTFPSPVLLNGTSNITTNSANLTWLLTSKILIFAIILK
jgi:filamentous hemagglutinin family protein